MPFWSKYTDPPTFMICGFKKEHMLSAYLGNTLCNNWTKTRGGIVDPLSIVLNKSLSAAVRALSSFPKPPSFIFQNSFT